MRVDYTNMEWEIEYFTGDPFHLIGWEQLVYFEFDVKRAVSFEMDLRAGQWMGADDETAIAYGSGRSYRGSLEVKGRLIDSAASGTVIAAALDTRYGQSVQSIPSLIYFNALNDRNAVVDDENVVPTTLLDHEVNTTHDGEILTSRSATAPQLLIHQEFSQYAQVHFGIEYEFGLSESVDAPENVDGDDEVGDTMLIAFELGSDLGRYTSVPVEPRIIMSSARSFGLENDWRAQAYGGSFAVHAAPDFFVSAWFLTVRENQPDLSGNGFRTGIAVQKFFDR
ncbi:MAG: hypothetical protein M5R36_12445 [Deltaproteobacteria bacterium]|nr:hypothetical protein [Deltaproteobacteria bacterium]